MPDEKKSYSKLFAAAVEKHEAKELEAEKEAEKNRLAKIREEDLATAASLKMTLEQLYAKRSQDRREANRVHAEDSAQAKFESKVLEKKVELMPAPAVTFKLPSSETMNYFRKYLNGIIVSLGIKDVKGAINSERRTLTLESTIKGGLVPSNLIEKVLREVGVTRIS